jgi:hypothetical protein
MEPAIGEGLDIVKTSTDCDHRVLEILGAGLSLLIEAYMGARESAKWVAFTDYTLFKAADTSRRENLPEHSGNDIFRP